MAVNKHICVDARMVNNSGIGVYVRQYINALINNSTYSLTLLGRKKELDEYFKSDTFILVEADFPIYSVSEQLKLPKLIPQCDLFWSPHYNIPILPISAGKRLVTIPDVFHLAHTHLLTAAQKFYAQLVTRAAAHLSNKIITISNFSAREIARLTGVSSSKLTVIPLGLDTNLFRRIGDKSTQQRIVEKYKLPNKYVLFVGNVKPNKNLRLLVDAFSIIVKQLPDYHLVIAGKKDGFITGDQSLIDHIESDLLLTHRVSFSGYVETTDLPVLYSMSSVFAFPSLYEGFGFPPLEAMACGCPVVASTRASIPEVCGSAAHYVDPTDPVDIARGLHDVLTKEALRDQLILNGIIHVKQFDWSSSQQEFVQQIGSLLQ